MSHALLTPDLSLPTRPSEDRARLAGAAARASGRRRLVDPATCERDYSSDEVEFMTSMHAYKISSGRMFPTWSEVLEVLCSLGYAKPGLAKESARPEPPTTSADRAGNARPSTRA